MDPVIYHKKIQHMRTLRFLFPPLAVMIAFFLLDDLMAVLGGPRLIPDSDLWKLLGGPAFDYWLDLIWRIAEIALFPFLIYVLVKYAWRSWRYGSPDENALRLDEQSLTIVEFGTTTRWSWDEISAFRPGRSLLAGTHFTFDAPAAPDPGNRLLPWRRAHTPGSRQARKISDIFDRPILEIGERLSAFHGLTPS